MIFAVREDIEDSMSCRNELPLVDVQEGLGLKEKSTDCSFLEEFVSFSLFCSWVSPSVFPLV